MKTVSQRGFAPLVILLVVLIIAVIGVGTYYSNKSNIPQESNSVIVPSLSPKLEYDWNTYTNIGTGYSIDYPKNWVENAWPQVAIEVPINSQSVNFGKYKLPNSFTGEIELKKLGYLIEVWVDTDGNLEQIVAGNDEYKERPGYKKEKTIFNGLEAYKIQNTGGDFPRDRIVFQKGNQVYSISLNYLLLDETQKPEAQKIYQQILSTFKFINYK